MRAGVLIGAWIILSLFGAQVARADWQAIERVETYQIKGTTGAELYASIGSNGPLVGDNVRAIAHTSFKLTWSRKYERQSNACVLVSARPKLVLTYTLPKPASRLAAPTLKRWDAFIAGLRAHEKIHGDFIRDMVREIEAATIGLSVADDPQCRKIRTEMTTRLSAISKAQRKRSRDFDVMETADGGNVQKLVLELVNGN